MEITLDAAFENIPAATNFVIEKLKETDCPVRSQKQMKIAVDEMFGNICRYAYKYGKGKVSVKAEISEDGSELKIVLTDSGTPFDPCAHIKPDITLPKEKRKPGGLGIHMVRSITDDMRYEYKDGKNVLTIIKRWNKEDKK